MPAADAPNGGDTETWPKLGDDRPKADAEPDSDSVDPPKENGIAC